MDSVKYQIQESFLSNDLQSRSLAFNELMVSYIRSAIKEALAT